MLTELNARVVGAVVVVVASIVVPGAAGCADEEPGPQITSVDVARRVDVRWRLADVGRDCPVGDEAVVLELQGDADKALGRLPLPCVAGAPLQHATIDLPPGALQAQVVLTHGDKAIAASLPQAIGDGELPELDRFVIWMMRGYVHLAWTRAYATSGSCVTVLVQLDFHAVGDPLVIAEDVCAARGEYLSPPLHVGWWGGEVRVLTLDGEPLGPPIKLGDTWVHGGGRITDLGTVDLDDPECVRVAR